MTKCAHCPVATEYCRGLSVPRLCQLIDPACRQFDLSYLSVIAAETDRHIRAAGGRAALPSQTSCCDGFNPMELEPLDASP
jgi:hypothetical protein